MHLPCSNADRSLAVLRCCFRWSPGWVGGGLSRRSAWIVIDDHAKRSFLHADKRSLITQLGINIPIRDMRLLDFNLLSSGVEMGGLLVSVLGRGVRAQSLHLPPPPHTHTRLPSCLRALAPACPPCRDGQAAGAGQRDHPVHRARAPHHLRRQSAHPARGLRTQPAQVERRRRRRRRSSANRCHCVVTSRTPCGVAAAVMSSSLPPPPPTQPPPLNFASLQQPVCRCAGRGGGGLGAAEVDAHAAGAD